MNKNLKTWIGSALIVFCLSWGTQVIASNGDRSCEFAISEMATPMAGPGAEAPSTGNSFSKRVSKKISFLNDLLATKSSKGVLTLLKWASFDHSNSTKLYFESDSKDPVILEFGQRLGMGWAGAVYELKSISSKNLNLDGLEIPMVVKVPHALRFLEREPDLQNPQRTKAPNITDERMTEEVSDYNKLVSGYQELGQFPPVIPILGAIRTTVGTMIIKVKTNAPSLKAILAGEASVDPKLLSQNIQSWESLGGVIEKILSEGSTNSSQLDINEGNFAWMSNDEINILRQMGYNIATDQGLVLYEAGVRLVESAQDFKERWKQFWEANKIK